MRTAPWDARLQEIREAGRWRQLRTLTPTGPTTALLHGKPVIIACSNDYLGLAAHPPAVQGGGATGSRLISGDRPIHRALEDELTDWLGQPALLFPTGYQANLALFSTVCTADQTIASDALNHASMIDGLRLGKAKRVVVPHADPTAIPRDVDLIAVEGLFSMDGDRPNLPSYPTGPWLAVDEAHALGCIGPEGRGVAADQGVQPDITIGTFGKAVGAGGAFVSGPQSLIDLLINAGRSFIFTTGLPEPTAALALHGVRRCRIADDERARLNTNIARFRTGLAQLGWEALGDAHIVPIVVGPGAVALADSLLASGVFVPAIRWPTVAKGKERLRFTLSAAHTPEQLDRILQALGPAPAH